LLESLLEGVRDASLIADEAGAIVLVNAQAEKLFGYAREELLDRPVETLIPERYRSAYRKHRREFQHQRVPSSTASGLELFALCKDGREVPVEISLAPLQTDQWMLVLVTVSDFSERTRVERAGRLAAIVESTEDAILATTSEAIITEWNRGAEHLYGYTAEEAIGKPVTTMLVPPERVDEYNQVLPRVFRGEPIDHYETVRIRKDGSRVDVSLTISPIRDESGAVVAASAISRDLSERKRLEAELRYLAEHDPLTGLFNRRRFQEELGRELARARRYGSGGAVLAIDLDNFTYIHDSLGHSIGDELIRQTGQILRGRLRATDVLARIGGDEFAVLLPSADEARGRLVASSLIRAVRREASVGTGGRSQRVTASIGVAPIPEVGDVTAEELLVAADMAMYDAKESGRDRASVYSAEVGRQGRMQARLNWAERIRRALAEDRFVLHAQPILALDCDSIPRHELLLRMVDEDGELIPPGIFLYIAERVGLIGEIDRWVLREGIRLLGREQRAGRDIRIELNLSGASIGDPELLELITQELKAAGAQGHGLCVEITETAAVVNVDRARRFARQLGELGCGFAIDDFGAGFASFYYLKHLPFDYLKLDGEFIKALPTSRIDQLVVRSVVEIARGLGKRTIAECVGSSETVELLRSYGVDFAQGFYVARPKPLAEVDLSRPAEIPA
jgi:diguanylate cyclase (GGDEF)-like protein/PAS domain S-box-containing protein